MSTPDLIVALLSAWFAATVVRQVFMLRLPSWLTRWTLFRLVPAWRLFASYARAFRATYRDRLDDGRVTEWQPLVEVPHKSWRRVAWNPGNWIADVVHTWVEDLVAVIDAFGSQSDRVKTSFALRALRHHAHGLRSPAGAIARQLMIVEVTAADTTTVLFLSDFEEIGRRCNDGR